MSGIVAMLVLKMYVFKDRHVFVWSSIRASSDRLIHRIVDGVREKSVEWKTKGLLKMVTVVYDSVIPFLERQYRKVASSFYKLHRRLWSFLEYSKHSSRHVSDYLKKISEDSEAAKEEKKAEDAKE